ncbi:MAG: LysE family transporter [Anaerolineales bacterium]|nr:LysE family transporter [Anaerolineales bacterium]NUQ83173.1 LysE family transporter [Anaerolineales bacterium]
MWLYVLQGVGLGFSAAVLPGPFLAYLISQTLERGWRRALPAAFAPLVSDGPIITLCLLVLSQVPGWFERFLHFAGGSFILYLAFGAYKAWRNFDSNLPSTNPGAQGSVFKAALMNALSPGPYIYWSLVTGPILLRGWRETPVNGIGFLAGFYATIVLSLTAIILVFSLARELGPKFNRAMLGVSAIALLIFGIRQLWLGILG